MSSEQFPPLRMREADGSPNVIPVYEIVVSNALLKDLGGGRVSFGAGTGGTSAIYAATGNSYVVMALAADLTAERVATQGMGLVLLDGGAGGNLTFNADTALIITTNGGTISAPLTINGSTDTVQFFVRGATSQTNLLAIWESSNGVDLITFSGLGGAVFNEAGHAVNFRVEADTDQNAFFMDGIAASGSGAVYLRSGVSYGRLNQNLELNAAQVFGGISFNNYSDVASNAHIVDFNKSASPTQGTQAVVANGEVLSYVDFRGSDGSAFQTAVRINAEVDGNPAAGDMPGRLRISTCSDGTVTLKEAVRIDADQRVGIGTTAPAARTHVDQANSTNAIAALALNQGNTSQALLTVVANTAAGDALPISGNTGILAGKMGAIKIIVNGQTRWINIYDAPS